MIRRVRKHRQRPASRARHRRGLREQGTGPRQVVTLCLPVSAVLCLPCGYGSGDLAKSFWSGFVVWAASSDGLGYLGETGILQLWHVACFCPKGSPQYGHAFMLTPPESVHAGQMPSGSLRP